MFPCWLHHRLWACVLIHQLDTWLHINSSGLKHAKRKVQLSPLPLIWLQMTMHPCCETFMARTYINIEHLLQIHAHTEVVSHHPRSFRRSHNIWWHLSSSVSMMMWCLDFTINKEDKIDQDIKLSHHVVCVLYHPKGQQGGFTCQLQSSSWWVESPSFKIRILALLKLNSPSRFFWKAFARGWHENSGIQCSGHWAMCCTN